MTASIQVLKSVNGQDADSPTGPHVAAGSTVTFTYVVTNTGNVPLADIAVTDDMLGLITSFTGDTNNNGLLDLTETWTYTQTATALAGQQTNLGTVIAQDANPPAHAPVTDDWHVQGVGDFNGDGNSDVLWRLAGPEGCGIPRGPAARVATFEGPKAIQAP
jgi:uncharacterized repeat protein (TIGR01451 family)